jgi:hypothetical protein
MAAQEITPAMMTRILKSVAAFGILAAAAGCQDLNVPNTNDPDRQRALANAADVEALVGSQFLVFFNRLTNRTAVYNPVPVIADEMTATYANDGALEGSSEPRVEFNNKADADIANMSILPYREFNSMVASANDVLNVIDDGLIIETPSGGPGTALQDNTLRTRAFAQFTKAIGQGHLALYFDSAFVIDQEEQRQIGEGSLDAKTLPLQPYPEVRDSAIARFIVAIAIANLPGAFNYPANVFFRSRDVNDELFARIAHTYAARFLVYTARTPAERAAVDWDEVLAHLDSAIVEDLVFTLSNETLVAGYLTRISTSGTFVARADYKMVGPADQPGRRTGCDSTPCETNTGYSMWIKTDLRKRMRFDIITPDRRITGPLTTDSGLYFIYRANDNGYDPTRGTYHFSAYQWQRNNDDNSGQIIWMSRAEVDLMRAEAYYFKGNFAQAAALVSGTRAHGQLEPITGEEGDQSADCVPRRTDGTCGNLYDAIIYERTIEAAGQDALRTYFDSRGFGRLVEGTFLQLPLSINELVALGKPSYTYGGVGGVWAAAKCTVPTLTCHPSYD